MALPIRLVVGPNNLMEIPLDAQSIDIVVNRNASAFPTPNGVLERFAIDTNTPSIHMEIDGILQDDTNAFESESQSTVTSGGAIGINFASNFPTRNLQAWAFDVAAATPMFDEGRYTDKIRFKEDYAITTTKTDLIDCYNFKPGMILDTSLGTDLSRIVNHPSGGSSTYSVGTTSIAINSSISTVKIGQRLHKADGTLIGTVTGNSGTTLSFSAGTKNVITHADALWSYKATLWTYGGQAVGSIIGEGHRTHKGEIEITDIQLDGVEFPIETGVHSYIVTGSSITPFEDLLHHKKIRIYPNFWRDGSKDWSSSHGGYMPKHVELSFDAETTAHSDYQNFSSTGSYPSLLVAGTQSAGRFNGKMTTNVHMTLPIGRITTHAVNGNPASTLALIVKKALDLTTDVMSQGKITSTGGETLASAFTTTVSGPTILIEQKDPPLSSLYNATLEPCLQYDIANVSHLDVLNRAMFEHTSNAYIHDIVSNKSKSAGDKVQDLLGIISNSKKDVDLIRGVQIPYDSLIQSSAVTPIARNFFLTFGEQSIDNKGSLGNTISASSKMNPSLIPGDLGGNPPVENESSWLDQIGLGELGEAVGAITEFVGNFVNDTFVTLRAGPPHGNDGGMRIIPEKLHVRYDAGNNYYAFKLKLVATDFVIGV